MDGCSLDAQRERIRAWAAANGYHVAAMHEDAGISGKAAANRPGLLAALADACAQHCPLVVYSLSRFARSTVDALRLSADLERAGADLVSLSEKIDTTSATGKMVFRLMSVLAEFERDQLAERTKTALDHLRRKNQRVSRWIPYGFDLVPADARLVENAQEQAVILDMQAWRQDGLGYGAIGKRLNSAGIPSKRGGRWHADVVRGVLLRAASEAT